MSVAKRGDVWMADLGTPSGHEQALRRPCIVLQSDDLHALSTTVIIPLTTKFRQPVSVQCVFVPAGEGGLHQESFALCHQLRVLDRRKLENKLGSLSAERMSEVEAALLFVLALP